nr:hypothetical protein Itr_chr01CG21060 [Ipomoea trifida]GMC47943.1 hypothetical protein Iba_chr01aCG16090 [Ipomoea batatas]
MMLSQHLTATSTASAANLTFEDHERSQKKSSFLKLKYWGDYPRSGPVNSLLKCSEQVAFAAGSQMQTYLVNLEEQTSSPHSEYEIAGEHCRLLKTVLDAAVNPEPHLV